MLSSVNAGRWAWLRGALLLAVAGAGGSCRTRLGEVVDCEPVAEVPQPVRTSCRETRTGNQVDALFLVDNSGSMDAMQAELRRRFPQFLQVFHDLAQQGTYVDLHIGVVTSDYGAGATGGGGCERSPGGDRGLLQAVGQAAAPECKPPVGAPYIQYVFGPGGSDQSNLPPGQSLDATFTCMASVGARGCGIEHQLESVYAALHNKVENAGFLRDEAVLAVTFLTNEDDCSAPATSDLFDPAKVPQYGYAGSFRCTRFGVVCGEPPSLPPAGDSNGPLAMCLPAPNPTGMGPGRLFDVGRYLDFFGGPAGRGGVKVDPADVLLVGIDAPEAPFQIIDADIATGQGGQPYVECAPGSGGCAPVVQHSCFRDNGFYGDPSVRINTVIRSARSSAISSICDDDYSKALENVGRLIVSQLGACCLPGALPVDPRTGSDVIADCTVEDLTQNLDGTVTVVEVPSCNAGRGTPCWRVERKDPCVGLSPQTIGVTIDRGGAMAPPHTTARATCKAASG